MKAKLKHIAPQLLKVKKTGFDVPEGYFDSLEDVLIARLKAEVLYGQNMNDTVPENYFSTLEDTVVTEVSKSSYSKSVRTKVIKILAPISIAASLLFLFTLNASSTVDFNSIKTSELENWIYDNHSNFDIATISNLYSTEELPQNELLNDISNEALESYFSNEDLDYYLYNN